VIYAEARFLDGLRGRRFGHFGEYHVRAVEIDRDPQTQEYALAVLMGNGHVERIAPADPAKVAAQLESRLGRYVPVPV
jgi:hypothetical protein